MKGARCEVRGARCENKGARGEGRGARGKLKGCRCTRNSLRSFQATSCKAFEGDGKVLQAQPLVAGHSTLDVRRGARLLLLSFSSD